MRHFIFTGEMVFLSKQIRDKVIRQINLNRYIIFLFLLSSYKTTAQTNIGIDAGATFNTLSFKNSGSTIFLTSGNGYIVSIPIQSKITKYLAVEIAPSFLEKNYNIENQKGVSQKISNSYFQLPIGITSSYSVYQKISVSCMLGIYSAYWLASKIDGYIPNVFDTNESGTTESSELIKLQKVSSSYEFDSKYDNRFEFGWTAKVGVDYPLANRLSISLKGHIYRSFTDQQKKLSERQTPKYNQTFATTLGLAYKL